MNYISNLVSYLQTLCRKARDMDLVLLFQICFDTVLQHLESLRFMNFLPLDGQTGLGCEGISVTEKLQKKIVFFYTFINLDFEKEILPYII